MNKDIFKMSKSISRFTESELQRLEEAGVINGELRQQIQAFYQKEAEAASATHLHLAVVLLSVLGGLLFSCGVILLLAYNWDMFPRLTRVALSMAPMPLSALFGCWAIKGNRGHAACEPAALCTAAATATALALVSQIYNIDGSFSAYLLTLLTVTLPLTWIFRSTALAAVQSFFILSQLGNEAGFLKFALTLSIGLCLLGFAFHQLRTAGTWHAALLRCISSTF